MKVRVTTVIGLLLFLQLHCGGTSSETFSPSPNGSGFTPTTGDSALSASKGVFIEGSVKGLTSSTANITIGADTAQEVTIAKNIVSDTPADEEVVRCKRYDGVTVANGSVDALGEIAGTVVVPASLDATEQVLCEVELEDGRTLLNHYDLTDKAEGDRVRLDVSADSTAAAEQVLSECGPGAAFENMAACAYSLRSEDFNPRKLFEKYRDKIAGDSYGKVEEPLNPVVSEEDAKKFFELVLQTPYGLDKTRDASEQGNLGRPLMGEPYGQDKDAEDQGKERGRPFRYASPPEPPPPEPPPVILEAPVNTKSYFSVLSSGWDLAITPETLGGARYQSFARPVTWSYTPDPDIAGFYVYDKAPGESVFHLLQTVDLSKSSAGVILSSSGGLVNVWLPWSGGIRMATEWPLGTYESYVTAYDAEGKEGPAGEIAYATNLGEIQWLRPTEGQILETYFPTFQWSNVWPEELLTSGGSGWAEFTVSAEGSIYNIYHASNIGWLTTFWRGPLPYPGKQHYAVLNSGVFATSNGAQHFYLAYSRLVGFTAQ